MIKYGFYYNQQRRSIRIYVLHNENKTGGITLWVLD